MSNIIEKLPDDARRIQGTMNWIDRKGNVYGIETRIIPCKHDKTIKSKHKNYGKYFKYVLQTNNHNGYIYCQIKYIVDSKNKIFKNKTKRVHILVAKTFIENPNNYPIVGHKNNIKTDNRVENLYWTTPKENTQKAVNDGLLINDKGYNDSQSMPVVMFDTYTNKELGRYGSATIASNITGISKNTILRQSKYKKPVRKPFYFRFQDDKSIEPPDIVVRYEINTNKEIGRYWNTFEASRQTGVNPRTILSQCKKNNIPNWTKDGTYFLYKKA